VNTTYTRLRTICWLLAVPMTCLVQGACVSQPTTSKPSETNPPLIVEEQKPAPLAIETTPTAPAPVQRQVSASKSPPKKRPAKTKPKAGNVRPKKAEIRDIFGEPPKRQALDPIYVNLVTPILDTKVQEAEKPKGAVTQQIRDELTSDPVIHLVQSHQRLATASIADVDVSSSVSIKDIVTIDRKTGKPAKVAAVVFEATITSQVPPATYTVSETGHMQKHVEASRRFAQQIREIIVDKIGPRIPAH